MALFGYTPAYQGHIALLGHLRYALQLNVHFSPELDLLPQPAPVLLNNFFEGPIASHSKGLPNTLPWQARHLAPDIDSWAAICMLVFKVNHDSSLSRAMSRKNLRLPQEEDRKARGEPINTKLRKGDHGERKNEGSGVR
jgi:hypothetical protein